MLNMNDCMRTHPLLHLIMGIGIGMLLLVLLPSLWGQALTLGLICVLATIIGEIVFLGNYHKKGKR